MSRSGHWSTRFLDLLYAEAPEEAFDAVVVEAERAGTDPGELDLLRAELSAALRLRDRMHRHHSREAQLTALYETANDLIAIRDVDAILTAIVRRARQLLQADMTYLSLNDEAEGASYLKVTDGSISAEFRKLRLPLGTGLLGLVAQTGAPYYTADYQGDQRFVHRDDIDRAVAAEGILAILGVPLLVDGTVIGALLAVHRRVREFPSSEVTLLTSFAAHAAVALENARLFEATQAALAEVDATNRRVSQQSEAMQIAAAAHDRLTDVLIHGGDLPHIAAALADVLEGSVSVYDAEGRGVFGDNHPLSASFATAVEESRQTGHSVDAGPEPGAGGGDVWVAAVLAGAQHLGTVVLRGRSRPLEETGRRTLERGAVVTALVLLMGRTVADAEDRVRGELLSDLLSGHEVDPLQLRNRARRHRAELDQLRTVIVADVGDGDRHRAAQAASQFAREHAGLGGAHAQAAVVVVPECDAMQVATAFAARVKAASGTSTAVPTVGVARADRGGLEGIRAAWAEATGCLTTLVTLGRVGQVSDSAGLGLARLVLGHNGPEELATFLHRTLGPLVEYDLRRGTELMQTLETWYACGGAAAETARRLHVHPNTVAQRLDRIATLFGKGWRAPQRALEQQLALQVWRLRDGKPHM